jgi:hypothetical protein
MRPGRFIRPWLAGTRIGKAQFPPLKASFRAFEREVLDEARAWGLDWHGSGGRLMALELLAALQHYGVPTRMLDFTFNPLIALWFAVETVPKDDGEYGRVFALGGGACRMGFFISADL